MDVSKMTELISGHNLQGCPINKTDYGCVLYD